jgi:hypothetical protein
MSFTVCSSVIDVMWSFTALSLSISQLYQKRAHQGSNV